MTVHLIIIGKVQGVYYRASAKDMADSLGIRGWVKNAPGGHVEVLASGRPENIERFVTWCKNGPPRAKVAEVQITEKEEMDFENFRIKRSGE